ncbi:MAG: CoA transferase, partial [Sphingobium sp.]
GPLNATKDNDGRPLAFSVPQSWLHASADAAGGALVAHFARLATGRGQHVDISAQASITQSTLGVLLAEPLGHKDYDFNPKPPPSRKAKKVLDQSGSGSRTRRSKWKVKDGLVEMHLGIGKAAGPVANIIYAWVKESGGLPEEFHDWDWRTVPERVEAGEIDETDVERARDVMVPFLAQFDRATLLREAIRRKVPIAPINDIGDLVASEHMAARDLFVTVEEQGRERRIPWAIARGPADMMAPPRAAPAAGEHDEAVLGGLLGLSPGRIAELTGKVPA